MQYKTLDTNQATKPKMSCSNCMVYKTSGNEESEFQLSGYKAKVKLSNARNLIVSNNFRFQNSLKLK